MKASVNKRWLLALVVFGIFYIFVGIAFGQLGWRMSAWFVSAVAFAMHICYQHFRLRSSPHRTALHASAAAALGSFGLAVSANIHELSVNPGNHRLLLLLALVLWPIMTALPAFAVALAAAAGLARWRPNVPR